MKKVSLKVPDKLIEPLFYTDKKHRLFKGGRGGGKSESIARALIYMIMNSKETRHTLCTRSVQNSIKDSVYSLLKKIIKSNGLESIFSIFNSHLECKLNNSNIIFRGCNALADPKSEAAKGLDDVAYCWVEEAHTATERDIDVLVPSIRGKNPVFFYSYNSNKEPCFVSEYFGKHSNAEITTIQYHENPFCPNELIEEAEEMKRIDEDKYREIWLGEPSSDTSRNVLIKKWIDAAFELYEKRKDNEDGARVYGLDVADEGADYHALAIRTGLAIHQLWKWEDGDPGVATDKTVNVMRRKGKGHLVYDRVGVGSAVKSTLREKYPDVEATKHSNGDKISRPKMRYKNTDIKNKEMFLNFGAQQWWYVRDLFCNAYKELNEIEYSGNYVTMNPDIKYKEELVLQLLQIEFTATEKGQIKIIKAPDNCDSPNLADSVQMCLRKPKILSGVITV